MLPDGFKWQSIYGPSGAGDTNALVYRAMQIARLDQRVEGSWFATLYYPDGRTARRECSSYAAGRAGCEAWAHRHQRALIAKAEQELADFAATQRWRSR